MTVNTLGGEFASGRARAAAWLPPLVPFAIATFALSALVSYHVRADGGGDARSLLQWAIIGIYEFVGFVPAFMFFVLVLSWSSIWFFTGRLERPGVLLARISGFALALAIWINLPGDGLPHSGALGAWIGGRMVSALGTFLSMLLAAPLTLVSLFLATDFFFVSYFEGRWRGERADEDGGAETGVEADVTEQFKALSRVFAPSRAGAAAAPATRPVVLDELVELDDLHAALGEEDGGSAVGFAGAAGDGEAAAPESDAGADEDEAAGSPRRLSHFERRRLAALAEVDPALAQQEQPEAVALPGEPSEEPVDAEAADPVTDVPEAAPLVRVQGRLAPPVAAPAVDEPVGEDADAAAAAPVAGPVPGSAVVSPEEVETIAAARVDGDQDDDVEAVAALGGVDDDVESEESEESDESVDSDTESTAATALREGNAAVADGGDPPVEPVVSIPRPAEGVRQQRLFLNGLDDALVREATEIVQSTRRASASMLQRRLRIDYEQAMEVLALLAHRGVLELAPDGSQGRVRS